MDGGVRELGSRDEVFFACVRGLAGWRCGYKVGRLFWVERQAGKGRKSAVLRMKRFYARGWAARVRGFHIAAISDLRLPVLGVLCSDEVVAWEGKGLLMGGGFVDWLIGVFVVGFPLVFFFNPAPQKRSKPHHFVSARKCGFG